MILFSRCTRRGYRYCKFLKYAGVQDMAPIMDRYGALEHIGEGTFGKVYKSVAQETGKPVAIKIVPLDPDAGLPFTVIREIKVLKRLKHPSILNLLDICISGGSIAMVLDYMPYDIAGLMAQKYNFTNDHIRSFTYQMIAAVSQMHKMGLIHRDLKPSNLLLDASGHLKIADFGLTKRRSECMTNRVCTLWYRAPELLLGDTSYSDKVDSWSIGCIILELKRGIPFFRGRDEVSQTLEVLSKLGCPQNNYPWNSLFDVSRYEKNLPWKCVAADAFSSFLDDEMLALVGELLRIDKNARISVTNALEMPAVKRGVNLHVPLDPIVVSKKGVE